jgi:hypothetical protein
MFISVGAGGTAYQNRPIFQSSTSINLPAPGTQHSRHAILRAEQERVRIADASVGKADDGKVGRFPDFQAASFGFPSEGEGAIPGPRSQKQGRVDGGKSGPQEEQLIPESEIGI